MAHTITKANVLKPSIRSISSKADLSGKCRMCLHELNALAVIIRQLYSKDISYMCKPFCIYGERGRLRSPLKHM